MCKFELSWGIWSNLYDIRQTKCHMIGQYNHELICNLTIWKRTLHTCILESCTDNRTSSTLAVQFCHVSAYTPTRTYLWSGHVRNSLGMSNMTTFWLVKVISPSGYALFVGECLWFVYKLVSLQGKVNFQLLLSLLPSLPSNFHFNPLKTSPEYTLAGVYGKCLL